jgi:hypothetical protein
MTMMMMMVVVMGNKGNNGSSVMDVYWDKGSWMVYYREIKNA